MKRLVVLISGSGSNLQSIIDACEQDNTMAAEVVAVISNKAEAYGLERAANHGIRTQSIDHKAFAERELFDAALAEAIEQYEPDLIVLAGFMRILTPAFTQRFTGKMLNIHPSLLPKYPGLHTHKRAIDSGDETAGATIHFVTAELDGGPCVLQADVTVDENETAESLAKKVLTKEHIIYPLVIKWFAQERLKLEGNHAYFDQQQLPSSGIQLADLPDYI